jgi:signal transduction histidine kinase
MSYYIGGCICLCYKTLLFVLFFLQASFVVKASTNDDFDSKYKLVRNIINKANLNQLTIDSLIINGDDLTKGCVYLTLANNHYRLKDYKKSDSLLQNALKVFELGDIIKGKGYYHFYKANNAKATGDIDKSALCYQSALSSFNECSYIDGIILCCSRLASYFSQNRNIVEAQKYFEIGKKYLGQINHKGIKLSFQLNLAAFYTDIAEADSAILMYYSILREYDGNLTKRNQAKIYNNIASNQIYLKQFKEAILNYNKSLVIKEELFDTVGIIRTKQNIFRFYVDLNNVSEANIIHKQLQEYFRKDTSDIDTYVDFIYNETKYHLLMDNHIGALQNFYRYSIAEKNKSNAAFSDKLIEMQKSFELKEKDREIALLEKEDALNQARLKTKNILIVVTIFFLVVLLFVGYLINRQRQELVQSRRRLLRQKEDITGMNEQLRVSNLSKDRILSVIGHDLRGPVGGLKELIELYMELPEYDPKDIKNLLKAAREASTSTYHLLENLLGWANSQRGELVYNPVSAPILPLVKQTVQLLDASINTRRVQFEYDIAEAMVIQVDLNMLRTIIRNLVSNALKYSPQNSVITISAKEEGRNMQFCVCDEGEGMTAEETQRIFKKKETYFIGSEMTAKGTGLGLILCKEFVERHAGTIWIDSEKGRGTKVCFSIPIKSYKSVHVGDADKIAVQ